MRPRHLNFNGYQKEMTRQTRELINPWSDTWLGHSHEAAHACKKVMGETAYQSWMSGLPGEVDTYDFKAWTNIFENKYQFELTKLF
jgi:hypothetical protein